jgi:hypothetical protein
MLKEGSFRGLPAGSIRRQAALCVPRPQLSGQQTRKRALFAQKVAVAIKQAAGSVNSPPRAFGRAHGAHVFLASTSSGLGL